MRDALAAPAVDRSAASMVDLRGIQCGYDEKTVFEGVDLSIPQGLYTGVVGPSGSGKTTLLKVILGLVPVAAGDVSVAGQRIYGETARGVGYVPQIETVNWNFPVTVEQVVLMGRHREMGWLPWPSREDRKVALDLLEHLGIRQYAHRQIRALSGGEQQRVFLARALISRPRLLILDEPTSGVDLKTQHHILHLLSQLSREGVTIILTTHDLNSVARHLPWVICFNRSIVAQGDPQEVFTSEILSRTYNSEMVVVRQNGLLLIADSPNAGGHYDSRTVRAEDGDRDPI
ncbi:MAG TPA: metal ABC transporter ATP-binding protein [Nitrospiria bacterium]|nr:metal ABC transporter ATP-binding protein [Nitrospiria bacterium]